MIACAAGARHSYIVLAPSILAPEVLMQYKDSGSPSTFFFFSLSTACMSIPLSLYLCLDLYIYAVCVSSSVILSVFNEQVTSGSASTVSHSYNGHAVSHLLRFFFSPRVTLSVTLQSIISSIG